MPVTRKVFLWVLLLPLFCAGFGVAARADKYCSVVVTDMAFGSTIDILPGSSSSLINTAGYATISCSGIPPGLVVRVCVSIPSSAANSRVMTSTNPSATQKSLNFQVYTDNRLTTPWPDPLRLVPNFDMTNGVPKQINFYASINAGQFTASVGDYKGQLPLNLRVYPYSPAKGDKFPGCDTNGGYFGTTYNLIKTTAGITPYCKIVTTDMIFPSQTFVTSDVTANGAVTVSCTTDAPYWVGLDNGANAQNGLCTSATQRCMRSGANAINYDLFSNAARTSRWGSSAKQDTVAGSGVATGAQIPVYGKIPKPTVSPPPGTYTDIITVTVNF